MDDVALRSATPADLPAIVALLEAAHLPPWGAEDHLHNFVVAEQDGRVVACGGFEAYPTGKAAIVRSMAVDEALRRSGMGTRILEWVMGTAADQGLAELYLFTVDAHDFYLRFDFVDATLDDVPEAAHESTQYKFLAEHGKDWPQIVTMKKL
jgi:N-acetylglutamate synthase-like GNAT family acetyltransferase